MPSEYIPRTIDPVLKKGLECFGAVHISGPKWSGKTTTAEQVAKSAIYLQDPDKGRDYREAALLKPSNILRGKTPRLIDEWQDVPQIWDAVRFTVDRDQNEGQFILTGSNTIDEDAILHSGTGRICRLRMYTMSLFEQGISNGDVSLRSLFADDAVDGYSELDISDISNALTNGGWPRALGKNNDMKRFIVKEYCESLLHASVTIGDGSRMRDEVRMRAILRSLARNESTPTPNTRIVEDLKNTIPTHINTLGSYLAELRKMCVIDDLLPWSPDLRSKSTIMTTPTRHLTDPAISAYFLEATPMDLEMDPRTFGLLFESMVVRDLRAYAQAIDGKVYHYRDSDGLECDAIVHLDDGRWGAIEVKLSSNGVEEGVKNLLKLSNKIDTNRMKGPSFLAVIIATGVAHTLDNGVHVIPIGCLKE